MPQQGWGGQRILESKLCRHKYSQRKHALFDSQRELGEVARKVPLNGLVAKEYSVLPLPLHFWKKFALKYSLKYCSLTMSEENIGMGSVR